LTIAFDPLLRNDAELEVPRLAPSRILHVATRYLHGGSERRLRDIVRSVPEADHHLIVGRDSDLALVTEEVDPARLTVMSTLVRDPDPRRDLMTLRSLRRVMAKESYDLIVSHQSKAGVLSRMAAGRCDVPVVHSLSMANFGPGYGRWQSAIFRAMETRLARRTTAYVVVGSDLARRFVEIGVPADKLHVVRSGVTLPAPRDRSAARAEACRSLGLPADRPLVVYLGSLEQRKNVLDLPGLLAQVLSSTTTRPFLVVAGTGPLAGPLQEAITAAGMSGDAKLVGFVREPGALLRAAGVVVLLSSAEGVPQVLVQAAAARTPFVSYAVDGVRELMDLGAVGVPVPLGDVSAAAAATRALLDGGHRGPRAEIDFSTWTPESIRTGYRHVIGSALAGRAGDDSRPVLHAVTP
jgi:glycosyltransferase involved in cell wall biosynthesis